MGLWDDCPWSEIIAEPSIGVAFYDTFMQFNPAATPYTLIGDTDPSWFGTSDPDAHMYGIARAGIDAVDNNEAYIASSSTINFMSVIADHDSQIPWWWSCQFRVSSISDRALFFGLANTENVGPDFLTDDTGALAADGLIGFSTLCGNPTDMLATYRGFGETAVTAGTSYSAIIADHTQTVGLKFDPATGLYFYVADEAMTGLAYDAETGADYIPSTALTFPVDQAMTFVAGIKTGWAGRMTLDLDSWRFAAYWG